MLTINNRLTPCVCSHLQGALSLQAHCRHRNQHLVDDQVRLSLRLHLLALGNELHNTNTLQTLQRTHAVLGQYLHSTCTVFVHVDRSVIVHPLKLRVGVSTRHPLVLADLLHGQASAGLQDQHVSDQILTICSAKQQQPRQQRHNHAQRYQESETVPTGKFKINQRNSENSTSDWLQPFGANQCQSTLIRN